MAKDEVTAVLGGWEGYTLGTVGRFEAGVDGRERPEVHLELHPIRDHPRVCSGCGRPCRSVHDTTERWVDDLPVLGADTRLLVHRVRVACPGCGPKVERLAWLEPYARVTVRLAESVARLCKVLAIKHAANRKLAAVYLLKDDLKELWAYRHAGYAKRFWDGWYARAIRSRIDPLKAFARKLKGYLPGILSHCRFPLHTSVLEGINNKIKVIKRTAYGFRDDAYFFLKIRQAFPGVGR